MDCRHNNMTNLPDNVVMGTEHLSMEGNNIRALRLVKQELIQVKVFDLKFSGITTIGDAAMQNLLVSTQELILTHNNLHVLPMSIQAAQNQTKLWLGDNPYECNCDMMWMRDWLLNATNVMDRDNMTCASGEWKGDAQIVILLRL